MKRPTPARTITAARIIGQNIRTWRKLLNLTSQQLADRANISRGTLSRLENGDTGISFESVLNVLNGLGILQPTLNATDPFESDFGRLRADQELPKRVRN